MPKYNVEYHGCRKVTLTIVVEAKDEDEALDKVEAMIGRNGAEWSDGDPFPPDDVEFYSVDEVED